MADTSKTGGKTEPAKTERRDTDAKSAPDPKNAGVGLGDELQLRHEQRITVPGAPNVDARLDNRSGADRPPLESFPAKPQQIDGPDVMSQVEHTRATLAARAGAAVDRKGMFSPGPHGLSDESLRDGDTTFGTEGLTEAEAGSGAPKAG